MIVKSNIRKKVVHLWTVLKADKLKEGGKGRKSKKGRGKAKVRIEDVIDDLFDIIDDKKIENLKIEKKSEKTAEGDFDVNEEAFVQDQRTQRKRWVLNEDKESNKKNEEKALKKRKRDEQILLQKEKQDAEIKRMFSNVGVIKMERHRSLTVARGLPNTKKIDLFFTF